MIHTALSPDPIDMNQLREMVAVHSAGAIVVFEGTTRTPSNGRDVVSLDYEAYESRAEQQLKDFANDIAQRNEIEAVVAVHRIGSVAAGQTSVALLVASQHRSVAFDAARDLIEIIKSELAVWKKECYSDGTSRWL